MSTPASRHNPLLYEINARVWVRALSEDLGRPATLDDVPDTELDGLVEAGFVRIPRKPIGENARMPITDSVHADHPRSEATLR
jgi:hypothetical protein